MRKRKQRRKFNFVLLLAFSFCFVFMATAYSILSESLTVSGSATITQKEVSGGDFIESVVGDDDSFVENDDGSYNFVGDEGVAVNNYIEFPEGNSTLWRIISIDVDGNIKIIRDPEASLNSLFMANNKDTYNWETSVVLQNLKNWYQQNLSAYSDVIVQNPEWQLTTVPKNTPLMKPPTVLGVYTDSPIGLIRNDEILNSSGSGSSSDKNISSWVNQGYQWTMTAISDKPNQAWKVNGGKFMNSGVASSSTVYRPVIYLKSSVTFSGGTGTWNDPFVVS